MGGNALKTTVSKRMDVQRYEQIKKEIINILKEHYLSGVVPLEKPGKLDYGDLDIICLIDESKGVFDAVKTIHSKESRKNGHVVSFEYKGHQIDEIHVNTMDELEFAELFYSYGDTGMILGMMCKTVGLILKDRELKISLPKPLDTQKLKLTKNIHEVLSFLGLSYNDWEKGFKTLDEIFCWITSSRYFRPDAFKRESLASKGRKRDGDRPMFQQFVDFCERHRFSDDVLNRDRFHQQTVFTDALQFFDKKQQYTDLIKEKEMIDHIRQKFNGVLVMKWTGASGKKIGTIIANVKSRYTSDELYRMSEDVIKNIVLHEAGM